jgi:uncharacterized protein (TIGR03089 family)
VLTSSRRDGADHPTALWRAARASDASRPFLTYYDDATGERVELSHATTDNWVSKTANLIQDEVGLEPGDRVALMLPAHWLAPVWLLACFATGTVAVPLDPERVTPADARVTDAALVVTGPDTLDAARACRGERYATALRPLGGRFPAVPQGFHDLAADVPAQSDVFTPYVPVTGELPALAADAPDAAPMSGRDLLAAARAAAERWHLGDAPRVLSELPIHGVDGVLGGLLAPLVTGGSLVISRHTDTSALARRVEAEHVTFRTMGTEAGPIRVLPVAGNTG